MSKKQVCEKKRRAASVRATFYQQFRLNLSDSFLDGPEIQHILPNRVSQPLDRSKIIRFVNEVSEEKIMYLRKYEPPNQFL